jgi:nucleoside-diphosphate-sugar epimerase
MKVLVIGAAGFVGARLVPALRMAGHEVTGLVRRPDAASALEASGVRALLADASRHNEVEPAALAADATIFAPQLLLEPEFDAVRRLLDSLRGSGKHFIFTSGTGVLAQRTGGDWSEDTFAEDDPFEPLPWLALRLRTEALVRDAAKAGLRSTVIRAPMIWGHGEGRLVRKIIESVTVTGAACYVGSGLSCYSNVHVDDLAQVFVLALERGVPGALYHAVSGEISNRALAEAVAKILNCGTRSVTIEEAIGIWDKHIALIGLGASSRTRSPRTRRDLGWVPRHLDIYEEIAVAARAPRTRLSGQPYLGRSDASVMASPSE